jgi:ABC-type dipeptide/oligopeptide/nickel transport system permease subunit
MTLGPVTSSTDTAAPSVEEIATAPPGTPAKAIEGRSLGRIAWTRLKRDRIAMTGGFTVILLILVAVFAPVLNKLLGHPLNEAHPEKIDPNLGGIPPIGTWGGISWDFLLGVQPVFGRDMFGQIVYGARTSLLIAFSATLLAVTIGVVVGVTAGYFGGWIDSLFSRFMDLILAFPLVLFAIALISVLPPTYSYRVTVVIIIIGGFSWPYIGRIVRGQTLSLREREFVEAARSMGAGSFRIIFRELLPNLVAPILVYSTLIIPPPTSSSRQRCPSSASVFRRPPRPGVGCCRRPSSSTSTTRCTWWSRAWRSS